MIYRSLALAALVALIIGVVVLTGPQREVSPRSTTGPLRDPGYAARQAHLIQTGVDGQPVYTLDAALIQQQPDAGKVELQQVQLGFRDTFGNRWTARADRGELAQDSGVVQLAGAVRVNGLVPDSGQPAEITSEHLAFDTQAQIVSTHDPVTLLMAGRQLHSVGLVANLKERRVQLESSVHGSFSSLP
jgi:LPS export ABC transporter protein LptC